MLQIKNFSCAAMVSVLTTIFVQSPAFAERSTVTTATNMHGTPGLIDMPTAEVAPDSTLSFTYSKMGQMTTQGTLSFQVTPRFSASFRYSKAPGTYAKGFTFDRSFDLRFRLLDETTYMPALSLGLNDFLGTGLYAGEYVVATKSFGEKFRATAGLGWGRLASFGSFASPLGTRPANPVGYGGKLNYVQWFRGPVAAFGGLSYQATDKLALKAEYSSDAYVREVGFGKLKRRLPLNFGAEYEISRGISLAAYYMYGSTLGAQFTFAVNPRQATAPSGLETAPLAVRPRPDRSVDPQVWGADWQSDPQVQPEIQTALAAALKKDGQRLESMSLSATRAEVRVTNLRYDATAQAVGRVARAMTRAFPASVETFVIVPVQNGIALSSVTVRRSDIEAFEHAPAPDIFERVTFGDAYKTNGNDLVPTPGLYPKFSWALTPYTAIGLFDPDKPVRYDFGLRLSGRYEVLPGLVFSGAVRKKIIGNLNKVTRTSNSVLPHVRSDIAQYDIKGDPSIENLTLAWYGRPGRNLYSRVTFGYLEPMFAGISGEVLWKPVDSRFALGAEVNYVRQRAYDQLFGLQSYGVMTGHVSGYYDLGNGFTTQLDVGRYLAGDYGATLSVDRVFANGWRVGGFATLTNVPFSKFGEGSFDKGLRITIPIEWALGKPSREQATTSIRSLSRDGGARLQVNGRLFDWVQQGHTEALSQRWGKFWR